MIATSYVVAVIIVQMEFSCKTIEDTKSLAKKIGEVVRGGEIFAMHSDIGGGKTTFVKGLAAGMGVTDVVQSPTFTISQVHNAERGLELHHFDFYRLSEAGIMRDELAESLVQDNAVVVIEWGDIVHDIFPKDVINIHIKVRNDESRTITFDFPPNFSYIQEALKKDKK